MIENPEPCDPVATRVQLVTDRTTCWAGSLMQFLPTDLGIELNTGPRSEVPPAVRGGLGLCRMPWVKHPQVAAEPSWQELADVVAITLRFREGLHEPVICSWCCRNGDDVSHRCCPSRRPTRRDRCPAHPRGQGARQRREAIAAAIECRSRTCLTASAWHAPYGGPARVPRPACLQADPPPTRWPADAVPGPPANLGESTAGLCGTEPTRLAFLPEVPPRVPRRRGWCGAGGGGYG